MDNKDASTNEKDKIYAPVVSVLGHVDHGKTTLLDKISQTSIAEREKGGITQKVAASKIEILHEGKKRHITFIDTPGHEAFSSMRSQGVNASDIALLIVAADDGIMPQTKESIERILEAKIPYIVVITKTDLEGANVERVKQQLAKEQIALEGMGGNVPYIEVSAKTGKNIKELLDLIILAYDLSSIEKDEENEFLGVVIDSKLDKKKGVLVDVVIKQGVLNVGDKVFYKDVENKIRAIFDTDGKSVKKIFPGEAAELLGFSKTLAAGSILTKKAIIPKEEKKEIAPAASQDLASFFGNEDQDLVPIVLKSSSTAELEVVKNSLPQKVQIVYEGQGDINISDILLAKDFKALVIGFNIYISKDAKSLAESEKVFFKTYSIIYELLNELSDLLNILRKEGYDQILGKGEILEKFLGTSGIIAGAKVLEGRFVIKDKIKILRQEKEIGKAQIKSIRKGKEDTKQVTKGEECGIIIEPEVDFALGDAIMAYK